MQTKCSSATLLRRIIRTAYYATYRYPIDDFISLDGDVRESDFSFPV